MKLLTILLIQVLSIAGGVLAICVPYVAVTALFDSVLTISLAVLMWGIPVFALNTIMVYWVFDFKTAKLPEETK